MSQPPNDPPASAPPPPPYGPTAAERPRGRLLSMAALVVGLFATVSFCFPIFSIPAGVVAVGLGIAAVVRVRRGVADGGRMAWTGLVLGIVALIAAVVMIILARNFIEANKDCLDLPTQKERQDCLQSRVNR